MQPLRIVSDTSALSALARTGWLDWLRQRWSRVAVPEAVWRELQAIGDDAAWRELVAAQAAGWIAVHAVADRAMVNRLAQQLDAGECEAITLALELCADALLIDEADGREAARNLGLATTGTLGLIVWAKRQGLVDSADATVDGLIQRTRFHVSEAVRTEVRRLAGEGQ